ncbi:MAG: Crp/Fnr family transcriptional regulator [Actinomycetota bacterium]
MNIPSGNRLVDALPEPDRRALASGARHRRLEQREVLWEPGERIDVVAFPISGVISLLASTVDGEGVELATIGKEGMVGVSVVLGGRDRPIERAVSQIAGEALIVDADAFEARLSESVGLRSLMLAYTHALLKHVAQGVACNRLHPVEQRCARWLLATRDRVDRDELELTHEFLAQMLGVRRASVSETLGVLQRAGLVGTRRGAILIEDPSGLRDAACECYEVVREEYDRLLPAD